MFHIDSKYHTRNYLLALCPKTYRPYVRGGIVLILILMLILIAVVVFPDSSRTRAHSGQEYNAYFILVIEYKWVFSSGAQYLLY